MNNFKLLILLIITSIVSSCDKDEAHQLICCNFEISYEKEHTLESNWSLIGIVNRKPRKEECANGVGGTITFINDSIFTGNASCNAIGGHYEIRGPGEIVVLESYQTLRGCIGNESEYWEAKFTGELRKVEKFEIDGNKLVLYTSAGNQLVFIAFD